MSANTGGPASEKTLLDEFAGQALAGLYGAANDRSYKLRLDGNEPIKRSDVARDCYAMASAMLAEKARREADHSPDAGKMVELEAANTMLKREIERLRAEMCETVDSWAKLKIANSELVEALELAVRWIASLYDVPSVANARAILAKHKGDA